MPIDQVCGIFAALPGALPGAGAPAWRQSQPRLCEDSERGDLAKVFAKLTGAGGPELRDAWGTEPAHRTRRWDPTKTHYIVRSAGPDQAIRHRRRSGGLSRSSSQDDRRVVRASRPSSIDVNIEHDRGPFNGLAEIAGTVVDQSGRRVLERATVQVRELPTGKTRTAKTNADRTIQSGGPARRRLRGSGVRARLQERFAESQLRRARPRRALRNSALWRESLKPLWSVRRKPSRRHGRAQSRGGCGSARTCLSTAAIGGSGAVRPSACNGKAA